MPNDRRTGGTPSAARTDTARRRGLTPLSIGSVLLLITLVAVVGFTDLTVIGNDAEQAHRRGFLNEFEVQSLSGTRNNPDHPDWGIAGVHYVRMADSSYADGIGEMVEGPNVRYVSNRIFNDQHLNLHSPRDVNQWAWVWGQFIDHDLTLRDDGRGVQGDDGDPQDIEGRGEGRDRGGRDRRGGRPGHGRPDGDGQGADGDNRESRRGGGAGDEVPVEGPAVGQEVSAIPFNADDPLEEFTSTSGEIGFTRSAAAPGTGVTSPREQVNTITSYIDGSQVYGTSSGRLSWLRDGPYLYLPGDHLPRRDSRGDPTDAPVMDAGGHLRETPDAARVAGDVRANENIALQAIQTLLAREHNRIVDQLPPDMDDEDKFQIARRVLIATIQYITYNEFLPTMGIQLPEYQGYDPLVNPTVTNEFATVGFRNGHSMIHGELEMEAEAGAFTPDELARFAAMRMEVAEVDGEVEIAIPLGLIFFNPDLLEQVGIESIFAALGGEAQYANDEMIDNQLRSVLFQIPVPENPTCLDGAELPACYEEIVDLGALDIQRGRDHGMPSYNDLRVAYGLPPVSSFAEITGESTDQLLADDLLTPGEELDDPDSLGVIQILAGEVEVPLEEQETFDGLFTSVTRRTTVAARLQGIYGDIENVDAFVGMMAEPHVPGAEMGELQLAIWQHQFQALRDGDRFFYGNNDDLDRIEDIYGVDYRRTLSELITLNSDVSSEDLPPEVNVFFAPGEEATGPREEGTE